MKVHVQKDPARMRVIIRVEAGPVQGKPGWRWFAAKDGPTVEVAPGVEPPMYFWLPDDIAEAIGEALTTEEPMPATEHHLYDAIRVRDQLFRLLEAEAMTRVGGAQRIVQEHIAGRNQ